MKKGASSSVVKPPALAAHDYIRIVPMHRPGRPALAPTEARLTYRGGILLQNPEVFTIFWGGTWDTTPGSTTLMNKLNKFFADILVSPLMDQLAEYDVPAQAIGHGSFIGTVVIRDAAPSGGVTDSTLQAHLSQWVKAKLAPKPTKNTIYFVYLEPGVKSILGGGRSCQDYCGYHSNSGRTYYAVMPFPTCSECLGGLTVFDALTGTSSHELCEAVTDPVPGSGWYDDVNGEIGDICPWSFKQVAGYTVQLEWSNRQNKCV